MIQVHLSLIDLEICVCNLSIGSNANFWVNHMQNLLAVVM